MNEYLVSVTYEDTVRCIFAKAVNAFNAIEIAKANLQNHMDTLTERQQEIFFEEAVFRVFEEVQI